MVEEQIKEFPSGKILGIIETYPNGDKAAKTWPGRQILGYYRIQTDQTTDFFGRVLSKGNTVVSLIYTNKNK